MFIDPSLALGLSHKHMAQWVPVVLEGLLHTSVLPDDSKSEVGQLICVVVTIVDVES